MKKKIMAVDIDGILTVETEGWGKAFYEKRTPYRVHIRKVNELYKQGIFILLFSARRKRDLKVTKLWLREHGVKYNRLLLGKPQYDLFIDDRALPSFPPEM